MEPTPSTTEFDRLFEVLSMLRGRAVEQEARFADALALLAPRDRASALNLVHYLSVRQHDLRELQGALHRRGLSSLGRMEAYVAATLDAVLATLAQITHRDAPAFPSAPVQFEEGRRRLEDNTDALLGPSPTGRKVRIMVTMPSDAATDPSVTYDLLEAGMNVARINGAKDGPKAWASMLEHLEDAQRRLDKRCLVQLDLEGPNPRTGPVEDKLRVVVGDRIRIAREEGRHTSDGVVSVSCTLPEALDGVSVGHRVCYDDGAFEGEVERADGSGIVVRIEKTAKDACKIKANKGLNFPESELSLPSITSQDERVLDFAAARADLVALSFVRAPQDVHSLGRGLADRGASKVGIVLKVETRRAFEQLPRLLLAAMAYPPVGVMVARGDMGVELGFERLAEAQEEVLWMCEAAHVPVIWATQVLENLAKKGLPSRAEVTDAAMSGRAECVMLNKGDYIVDAVRFLDGVLHRMQDHQHKKLAMLRKLKMADA